MILVFDGQFFLSQACSECNQLCTLADDLRCHYSKHTNVYRHMCPREGCNYGTNTRIYLDRHLAVHDGINPFRCTVEGCKMEFRRPESLRDHVQRVHGNEYYSCDWPGCNKKYKAQHDLTRHKRRHRLLEESRFQCEFCKYRTTDKSVLVKHKR